MSDRVQKRVWISGRVQGVGYRAWLYDQALQTGGVFGFVRNLEDGRVEAVLCGPPASIEELVERCSEGPPAARVSSVDVEEEPVREGDYKDFQIAPTGAGF